MDKKTQKKMSAEEKVKAVSTLIVIVVIGYFGFQIYSFFADLASYDPTPTTLNQKLEQAILLPTDDVKIEKKDGVLDIEIYQKSLYEDKNEAETLQTSINSVMDIVKDNQNELDGIDKVSISLFADFIDEKGNKSERENVLTISFNVKDILDIDFDNFNYIEYQKDYIAIEQNNYPPITRYLIN